MRRLFMAFLFACAALTAGCGANAEAPDTANAITPAAESATLAANAAAETEGRPASAGHHTESAATPASDAATALGDTRVREITIPAGTRLRVRLNSTVSSRTSNVEDAVQATLRAPLVVNGVTVAPAGTAVSGYVSEARRSGRVKGRARVGVRFTAIRVDDTRYGMRTSSFAREAPGTKKEDATKIGIGAGAGAIAGGIAGGGRGAAIGSAVGGGAGTGLVLATRGREVSIGPGTPVTVRLSQPLIVRVR